MSGRSTTSAQSRPYTANSGSRPFIGWSDSKAPSTLHDPVNYAYPARFYEHQQTHTQHLPYRHHLYTPQEESYNDDDKSDDGHVFAYGPPSTSVHPPQLHQMQYSQHQLEHQPHHQQDKSQYQHLNAAQLHNLVSAAGLFTLSSAPPAPLNYVLYTRIRNSTKLALLPCTGPPPP